jgi:hypothetical protein
MLPGPGMNRELQSLSILYTENPGKDSRHRFCSILSVSSVLFSSAAVEYSNRLRKQMYRTLRTAKERLSIFADHRSSVVCPQVTRSSSSVKFRIIIRSPMDRSLSSPLSADQALCLITFKLCQTGYFQKKALQGEDSNHFPGSLSLWNSRILVGSSRICARF